jgi:catechol 2,3-dioxygenase-like lactoylglutathione lyase family enzyme
MHKQFSKFGPIMQLSFVPSDIEEGLRYWTETMGVGPFYKFAHVAYDHFSYLGESPKVDLTIFKSYWGDVQIELIQQHNDAPSTYSEWLRAGREGLHHVCIAVDDMAAVRAHCAQTGAAIVQEFRAGEVETLYVDSGGVLVEFAHVSAEFLGAFEVMRAAAQGWDGKDPVRVV